MDTLILAEKLYSVCSELSGTASNRWVIFGNSIRISWYGVSLVIILVVIDTPLWQISRVAEFRSYSGDLVAIDWKAPVTEKLRELPIEVLSMNYRSIVCSLRRLEKLSFTSSVIMFQTSVIYCCSITVMTSIYCFCGFVILYLRLHYP